MELIVTVLCEWKNRCKRGGWSDDAKAPQEEVTVKAGSARERSNGIPQPSLQGEEENDRETHWKGDSGK